MGSKSGSDRRNESQKSKHVSVIYLDEFDGGIHRKRWGRGFRYIHHSGEKVTDETVQERIAALAIPPAWEEVWISEDERTHIQAHGRDARGRKQYRYHAQWTQRRQSTKFDRMVEFGEHLPRIRRLVNTDLDSAGLHRRKVLACIVRLLDDTGARVGTRQYSLENKTFGISSMLNRHVEVEGNRVTLHYRGKGGKPVEIVEEDRMLARIVRRCQDLAGQRLFEYVDSEGEVQAVTSADVNQYLADLTREDFTSKDFRTWKGSVLGLSVLREMGPARSKTQAHRNVVQAMREVAAELGNRPATARKYYVHPAVIEAYEAGRLEPLRPEPDERKEEALGDLSGEEEHLMALLRSV